jgi:thymidylate synthase (FAD)
MAARGDYMDDSLVETDFDAAMDGTEKDLQGLLDQLVLRGHFGPFEHNTAVIRVEGVSRVVMAQVTRHRHMSFDVQSQRYVDFSDVEPVVPHVNNYADEVAAQMEDAIESYNEWVENGMDKEKARYVLPLGTPVNMTMSGNLRAMWHFLDLRNNAKAQPETQRFARKVCGQLRDWAPKSMDAYERKTNNNSLRAP